MCLQSVVAVGTLRRFGSAFERPLLQADLGTLTGNHRPALLEGRLAKIAIERAAIDTPR